jgi:hypothetical protein
MEPRVFTKGLLERANARALELGYNRATSVSFLANLPDGFYTPKYTLLHEHKAGERCAPHVRCVFDHAGDYFAIDVEMKIWDILPPHSEFARSVNNVLAERAAGNTYV